MFVCIVACVFGCVCNVCVFIVQSAVGVLHRAMFRLSGLSSNVPVKLEFHRENRTHRAASGRKT